MTNFSLDFYEDGRPLTSLKYSNSKTQVDVIEEILETFDSHDLIYLKAAVGTGKSVIGIRTALEFGGGIVSVPTKVLSDQYYNDYYADNKYFEKPTGGRAKITVFKGRRNFTCPYLEREHPEWEGWKLSCQNQFIPCRRPHKPTESRFEILEECPWAASVNPSNTIPSEYSQKYRKRVFESVGGSHIVAMKESSREPKRCPYYQQYWTAVKSDLLVMNSAKFKADMKIGRLPFKSFVAIDEGDLFLDSLCPEVKITQKRIEHSADLMRLNARAEWRDTRSKTSKVLVKLEEGSEGFRRWLGERNERVKTLNDVADLVEKSWKNYLDEDIPPIILARILFDLLGVCGWETELRIQLRTIIANSDDVSIRENKNDDSPKVTYYLPNPKPILRRILNTIDAKVLFMSATKPDGSVLREVFGIDPVIIEGEPKYLGTLVQKIMMEEQKVNYEKWQDPSFRSQYEKTRDKTLNCMERPAFVPCHGVKYLPAKIRDKDLTEEPYIKDNGVIYSTKMDRGSDLEEMQSVCLLKYPFADLKDPLLQEMKKHVGKEKFWSYYRDMARREFIQQIGRIMRSKNARKEFWSPDLTCHRMLQKHWEGPIEIEGISLRRENRRLSSPKGKGLLCGEG